MKNKKLVKILFLVSFCLFGFIIPSSAVSEKILETRVEYFSDRKKLHSIEDNAFYILNDNLINNTKLIERIKKKKLSSIKNLLNDFCNIAGIIEEYEKEIFKGLSEKINDTKVKEKKEKYEICKTEIGSIIKLLGNIKNNEMFINIAVAKIEAAMKEDKNKKYEKMLEKSLKNIVFSKTKVDKNKKDVKNKKNKKDKKIKELKQMKKNKSKI